MLNSIILEGKVFEVIGDKNNTSGNILVNHVNRNNNFIINCFVKGNLWKSCRVNQFDKIRVVGRIDNNPENGFFINAEHIEIAPPPACYIQGERNDD